VVETTPPGPSRSPSLTASWPARVAGAARSCRRVAAAERRDREDDHAPLACAAPFSRIAGMKRLMYPARPGLDQGLDWRRGESFLSLVWSSHTLRAKRFSSQRILVRRVQ